MRKTLADLFNAAREHERPIVHISKLAGEAPFVAGSPCLGNAPDPLLDITVDEYLGIMADIRNALVVEQDESLSMTILIGGACDLHAAKERVQFSPHATSGRLKIAGLTAAVYYLMDSAGQEATIIYCGLSSFEDIQDYWLRRSALVHALRDRYDPSDEDVYDLCYHLDLTTQLATFDIDAFARGRGLARRSLSKPALFQRFSRI